MTAATEHRVDYDDGTWTLTLADEPRVRLHSSKSGHVYTSWWVCGACGRSGMEPGNRCSPFLLGAARSHASSHDREDG